MFEYEGGFILPHLIDYVVITPEKKALHGKIGNDLEQITMEEAAKRVLYNYFEEHAWNIEENSIIPKKPKTVSETAMSKFVNLVDMNILESALEWCQEISYDIIQKKREIFNSALSNKLVEENKVY